MTTNLGLKRTKKTPKSFILDYVIDNFDDSDFENNSDNISSSSSEGDSDSGEVNLDIRPSSDSDSPSPGPSTSTSAPKRKKYNPPQANNNVETEDKCFSKILCVDNTFLE